MNTGGVAPCDDSEWLLLLFAEAPLAVCGRPSLHWADYSDFGLGAS